MKSVQNKDNRAMLVAANFEQISHTDLVFPFLTLNK